MAGSCTCQVCSQPLEQLCWTRLASGIWVLSQREHLFAEVEVLAATASDGDTRWFLETVVVPTEAAV